jgi:glycosyltransferase 2 family protein
MTTAYTDAAARLLPDRRRSNGLALSSIVLSVALVGICVWFADSRLVLRRLETVRPGWLVAAFLVSLLQLAVLGLRYAHFANALGIGLSWFRSTSEYALSVLLNQVLPTGMLGDGLRAVRHAQQVGPGALPLTLQAVVLDRAAGQMALWLVVLAAVPFGVPSNSINPMALLAAGAALGTAVFAVLWLLARLSPSKRLLSLVRSSARLLLAPKRIAIHLPLSLALTALLLLQLYIASCAIGVNLNLVQLCWVGPLILLASSVPSFFAGWGVREGASALLFVALGLPSSAGVAVALLFGAFTLMISLPGLLVPLFNARRMESKPARFSQAHALAMMAGMALALFTRSPSVLVLMILVSFSILIVQSRGTFTPSGSFGGANAVTSLRLGLTLVLLWSHEHWPSLLSASLVLGIIALDVLDGWWARRTGSSSPFGEVFDVEVDTILVVTVSLILITQDQAGLWVLGPALLRYAYVLAPLIIPPREHAPARTRLGRAAYVLMMTAFTAALVLPSQLAHPVALFGTALMTLSLLLSFWHHYAAR